MTTIINVFNGIKEVYREEMFEESHNNLFLDPNDFGFNKSTIHAVTLFTITLIMLVMIGSHFNYFCLLLFTGSSGTAIFFTHIMILILESVISIKTGLFFAMIISVYSGLILFFVFISVRQIHTTMMLMKIRGIEFKRKHDLTDEPRISMNYG